MRVILVRELPHHRLARIIQLGRIAHIEGKQPPSPTTETADQDRSPFTAHLDVTHTRDPIDILGLVLKTRQRKIVITPMA